MIIRSLLVGMFISLSILFAGCSSTKCLIEDCKSSGMSSQVIKVELDEKKEIINYGRGIMWGGFAPGLFSEDPSIVSVEYDETRNGHKAYIVAKTFGTVKVYFVNKLGAGTTRLDSAETAYWLERLEGSENYFIVEVE